MVLSLPRRKMKSTHGSEMTSKTCKWRTSRRSTRSKRSCRDSLCSSIRNSWLETSKWRLSRTWARRTFSDLSRLYRMTWIPPESRSMSSKPRKPRRETYMTLDRKWTWHLKGKLTNLKWWDFCLISLKSKLRSRSTSERNSLRKSLPSSKIYLRAYLNLFRHLISIRSLAERQTPICSTNWMLRRLLFKR